MSLEILRVVAANNAAAFDDDSDFEPLREGVPASMWRALK